MPGSIRHDLERPWSFDADAGQRTLDDTTDDVRSSGRRHSTSYGRSAARSVLVGPSQCDSRVGLHNDRTRYGRRFNVRQSDSEELSQERSVGVTDSRVRVSCWSSAGLGSLEYGNTLNNEAPLDHLESLLFLADYS